MTSTAKKIKKIPEQHLTVADTQDTMKGKNHENDHDLVHDKVHEEPKTAALFTKPNLKITKGKPPKSAAE